MRSIGQFNDKPALRLLSVDAERPLSSPPVPMATYDDMVADSSGRAELRAR